MIRYPPVNLALAQFVLALLEHATGLRRVLVSRKLSNVVIAKRWIANSQL